MLEATGSTLPEPGRSSPWRLPAAILLPPLTALVLQWLLWSWLQPFAWFMFYPAVFVSARLAGFRAGMASSLLSIALVWYCFLPLRLSWTLAHPEHLWSVALFLLMGYLISDVSERLLRARSGSEARFRATFEQAAVGLALLAPDGHWLRVNRRLCEIVGYPQEALLRLRFQDITHPEDLDSDLDQARRLLAGEIATYALDKRYIRRDGVVLWVRLTVALIRRPDGAPDYFIAVVEDIHDRKAAEQALQESQARLREAQRLAGLGYWQWDLAADQHHWSAEIYQIYGRDPALPPAIYPEVRQYFTPDSWERLAAAVEQGIAAGRAYECDAQVVRPDGGRRWITARGEAVRDSGGAIRLLRGTVQDITPRKAVEEALRASEERLRLFIDHAPAALATFDRQMRYLAASRRWLEDYELAGREVLGLSHYQLFPALPERWRQAHQRGLAGETLRMDEDLYVRADGSELWNRWELLPWYGADGGVGGIVIFIEDITFHKQALAEIRRLNSDLERRVIQRTAQLATANEELDSFAYAVSHDLRAPLRAMSGFSRALEEDCGHLLPAEGREHLRQIAIAGRRMADLIDGLLVLSRGTRGSPHPDRVDVSALARRLLGELAEASPARRVVVDVAPDLAVRGDARMLESVLANLLGNAWKYTARAGQPEIRVYQEERDGNRWICVADNGAGFDMAHAEHLFKPFQRLHRQDEFPGLGIGLATVRRIVQRHGGRLEAEGVPGRGATFRFALPEIKEGECDLPDIPGDYVHSSALPPQPTGEAASLPADPDAARPEGGGTLQENRR